MTLSLLYFAFYAYIVLDDYNMEWNKMLAYNAVINWLKFLNFPSIFKDSNQQKQYIVHLSDLF